MIRPTSLIFTPTVSCAMIVLLAACSSNGDSDQASGSTDSASAQAVIAQRQTMAETAWLSISQDGAVYTTYLDADGRYRDKHDGQVVYGGTWEQDANDALCFLPESGTGECWLHGVAGSDGVMRATNGSGRTIEVKRVTYSPPNATPKPLSKPSEVPSEVPADQAEIAPPPGGG